MAATQEGPWLVNEAEARGLTALNHCGAASGKRYLVEEIGNGCALLDYDGDGDLDALLVDGCTLTPPDTELAVSAELLPDATEEDWKPAFDGWTRLYRNDGSGHFEDVSEASGLDYRGFGVGISAADADNDGDPDLYLTCWGPNRLYDNQGDQGGATFRDRAAAAGTDDPRWSVGACWLDHDLDGSLDLYVVNYFSLTTARDPEVWRKVDCPHFDLEVACGPKGMVADPDTLYRNRGDGTFGDVSDAAGIRTVEPRFGLGAIAFDADLDGDTDLYVANDSRANYLFFNQGKGRFEELGDLAGVALSASGVPQAGMGVACGDFDSDLDLDLFVTNFSYDDNTLYRNDRNAMFRDITMRMHFGETSFFSLGWGTEFVDLDNDGDLDLFIANGHIFPEVDQRAPELNYKDRNRVFLSQNGVLRERTGECGPGLAKRASSRGAAFGDVDQDGDLDILVIEMNEPPTLLINHLERENANWVLVSVEGDTASRSAIGTQVTVRAGNLQLLQEVRAGHSYASCNDPRLHFGLGSHPAVETLQVRWPGGDEQEFQDLPANRWVHIRQGQSQPEVRPW